MAIKIEEIDGKKRHVIVAAIIKDDGRQLLFERTDYPFGFAAVCGHLKEGESVEQGLVRKLKEETDFNLVSSKLIFEDVVSANPCKADGVSDHMTYVFEVEASGTLKVNPAAFKSFGWYDNEAIGKLDLEPMWHCVFEKLGVI